MLTNIVVRTSCSAQKYFLLLKLNTLYYYHSVNVRNTYVMNTINVNYNRVE